MALRILIYKIKKMIINNIMNINLNGRTIEYYKEKGYDTSNKKIDICVKDLHKNSHIKIDVKCDICGNLKKISYRAYCKNIEKYKLYSCSNKCANFKNKLTSIELYGVDHFSKTKEFIDKVIKTTNDKYEKNFYTQTKEYKKRIEKYHKEHNYDEQNLKRISTNKKLYEAEYYQQSKSYSNIKNDIINKYKTTVESKLINKYKDLNLLSVKNNYYYIFKCNKNHNFEIDRGLLKNRLHLKTEVCTICNPIDNHNSGYEIQLQNFIKNNYSRDILFNDKKILNGKEIDIYLPHLKLGFEFNGLYWHNELNKSNDYHMNKTENCEKSGIQLVHIYEDDWINKQEIVKSMILNLIGGSNKIFSRKCEIKEIENNEIFKKFLEKNHLQSFVSSKIKIGLFYNKELISLMSFRSISQKNMNNSYEMLRFCNKLNIHVIDGEIKLVLNEGDIIIIW